MPLASPIYVWVKKQQIAVRMEHALEHENLHTIYMATKDLKWQKPGKEIIYQGHFFDIKTIDAISGDSLMITGLYDYEEDAIHEKLLKHKDSSGSQTSNIAMLLLFQSCFVTEISNHITNTTLHINVLYGSFKPSCCSITTNVPTPPPKLV